jgi:hypothetical protein
MKTEEFNKLSKEEQQEEIKKCNSFEYFYNNYCKREGMPEFSQESWEEYVENNNKQRFSRRRMGESYFYSLTPEECSKNKL